MRIGIHKLGFETHNFDPSNIYNADDKNGMFTEVNLIMKAFVDNGYNIEYVNTTAESFSHYVANTNLFDIIYVFNGFEKKASCLKLLRILTKELNYVLTDSRLYEKDNDLIDNYFVQSNIKMYDKPTFNSHIHKLPIYEMQFHPKVESIGKNGKFIFGGSIRERRQDIFEYIYRPWVDYYLKDEEKGIDNRLPIRNYKSELTKYSYGIVLINKRDIEIGNITWRYYEYIANYVITFVDRKADPDNQLLEKDSFFYVSSCAELVEKIEMLENSDYDHKRKALQMQNKKIKLDDLNGKTFVKSLLESREENVIRK